MIVLYYSDSLGLARPEVVGVKETYIYIFQQWLRDSGVKDPVILNRARAAFTINKLYEVFKEDVEYITEQKDILIIHEGVCDCAPRPVSKKLRNVISILPSFIKIRVISLLHNKRAAILKRGWGSYLVKLPDYEIILKKWLTESISKFKRIYILTIAPTNTEIEAHSPGFSDSINRYNEVIRRVVSEINDDRIKIVDVYSLVNSLTNIDEYIIKEDGHHITPKAHRLIADELIGLEKKWQE